MTCDKWDYSFKGLGDKSLGYSSITGNEWGQFARQTFINNVSFFSRDHLPFPLEMFSDELFVSWQERRTVKDIFGRTVQLGGDIGFCFIDGNHEYEFVKRDFEHVDRVLTAGGFIFFDDSGDLSGSPGVQKLMKELIRSKVIGERYSLILKNPNYLIQKMTK
jgi:hypothetical protein